LLHLLGGLDTLTRGEIEVEGRAMSTLSDRESPDSIPDSCSGRRSSALPFCQRAIRGRLKTGVG